MLLNPEALQKTLKCLDKQAVNKLLVKYQICSEPLPDEYTAGTALVLWTVDFLKARKRFDSLQLNFILENFIDKLYDAGKDWYDERANYVYLPNYFLGISDNRYVSITNNADLLDILEGDIVKELRQPVFETTTYNLALLFDIKMKEYENVKLQRNASESLN
jgi:hypothetical protein